MINNPNAPAKAIYPLAPNIKAVPMLNIVGKPMAANEGYVLFNIKHMKRQHMSGFIIIFQVLNLLQKCFSRASRLMNVDTKDAVMRAIAYP